MKNTLLVVLSLIVFQGSAHADFVDCRAKLPNRVFQRDPETGVVTPETNPSIHAMFVEAYDLFPAPMKALMCQFEEFTLYHDEAGPSAYSDMSYRRAAFDQGLGAEQWMTWKDQLNFGTPNNNQYSNDPMLPHVEVDPRLKSVKFLYFLMIHEIAHNTDRYGTSSRWNRLHNAVENEFEGKSELCSYFCEVGMSVPPQKAQSVYSDLFEKTNFLSLYTTRNSEEDFADSLAFYVTTQVSGYKYDLVFADGTRYKVGDKMKSRLFAEKLAILKEVYDQLPLDFGRTDLMPKRLMLRIEE